MADTDRAYVLIQRLATNSSSGRKGKEVRPSRGKSLSSNPRRFWEDVVLFDSLPLSEVLDTAKSAIEEIGNPGETYRIVSLDAPPTELSCKARVTVAEIVNPPSKSSGFVDDEDDEDVEEEDL